MSDRKSSMHLVTKEEVDRAADLWDMGVIARRIAENVGWTDHLFGRVVAVSRATGDGYFVRRNAKKRTQDDVWDERALTAAKKPVAPSHSQWKRILSERGLKPSTVPARDPLAYRTKRKITDPTLSLPRVS